MSINSGFIGTGGFDLCYNFAARAGRTAGTTVTNYKIGVSDLKDLFCPLGTYAQSTISTGYKLTNGADLKTLFAPLFVASDNSPFTTNSTTFNLKTNGNYLCLEYWQPGTFTIKFTNNITANIFMMAGGGSGGTTSGVNGTGGGGGGTCGTVANYIFTKNTKYTVTVGTWTRPSGQQSGFKSELLSGETAETVLLSFPPGGAGSGTTGGLCGNNVGITNNVGSNFTQINNGNGGNGATVDIAGTNGNYVIIPLLNGFSYPIAMGGSGSGGGGPMNETEFRNGGVGGAGSAVVVAGSSPTIHGQSPTAWGAGGGGCAYSSTSATRTPGIGSQGYCSIVLDISTQTLTLT
jgi:hypothetical protein